MDYKQFIEQELTKAAATAKQYFGKVTGVVKAGDSNQILTEADLAIGKQLVAAVQRDFPDHSIIDEETGVIDNKSTFTWVIDPIDGTSNFAAGLPHFGIMIGLLQDATPIAGGIMLPAFSELYVASKGEGAFCNGKPVHVTSETPLGSALVAYGIDGYKDNPARTIAECTVLAHIVLGSRNLRNSNSAFDLCMVACGRYGAVLNRTSKIWDNVAPQIICEEAGGVWTAFDGTPMDYTNPLSKVDQNYTFCAGSPALHQQLQAIIRNSSRA